LIVQRLPWDSEFFNLAVGCLDIAAGDAVADASKAVKSCDLDVVYLRVENPTEDQLEELSVLAPLVDHKIVYEKKVPVDPVVVQNKLPPYEGDATDALVELAWASGTYSRFRVDPRFRSHYQRLYQTWLVRSLEADLADRVFVQCVGDVQAGFVTVASNDHISQIGLIAVAEAYRGQGIGNNLLQNVDAWCQQSGTKLIRVVTQKQNSAAGRLYEKHGYQIAKTLHVYHYWKP
jgi:dTDP-4-amino-4,6-dideoxy-D-galactose acyltransferase